MEEKIGIQGIKGSFHHQVAQEYFGEAVKVDSCRTFKGVINSLLSGKSTQAVMAIENSIAGSILPNYALIDENEVKITGEHYIPIDLNLMTLPGNRMSDITEIYSHPIALLQCKPFFDKYPKIRLIEDTDTAGAARRVATKKLGNAAAVANHTSAQLYGLEIVKEGIHSVHNNSTRFLVLNTGKIGEAGKEVDKASLKFELDEKHGSLSSVLNILTDCNINLTKIQSLPIIETPWRYAFFIDVTFDEYAEYQKSLDILKILTHKLKVLGEYKNSIK